MDYGLIERLDDQSEQLLTVSYHVLDGQVQPHVGQTLAFAPNVGTQREMRVLEVVQRPDIKEGLPFVIVQSSQ
jgi:hypothetical protein